MLSRRSCWLSGLVLAGSVTVSLAQPVKPKPDLADAAAGVYDGDVISDARGAGRSGVRITVVKTGPNTVSVTSSYPRLPPFSTKLMRAMSTIQRASGPGVFLLELSKSPQRLGITVDDASWSGVRSY